MQSIGPPDSPHLEAAKGWLELGSYEEANEELEKVPHVLRAHPDGSDIGWPIYASAQKWKACLDIADAIIKPCANSGRVQDAHDTLLPVAIISTCAGMAYDLAC